MPKLKLTEAAVRKVSPAPAGKSVTYACTSITGLKLRVSDTGAKSWRLELWRNGRRQVMILGEWSDHGPHSVETAQAWALKHRKALDQGKDPVAEMRAEASAKITVAEAVDMIVSRHYRREGIRDALPMKSAGEAERVLRKYVVAALGKRSMRLIQPLDVRNLHDSVAETSGAVMALQVIRAMSKLFSWCALQPEWISAHLANPVLPGIATGKANKRDRWLNDAELSQLWAVTHELPAPRGQFIRLLLLTGQRRGEVAKMKWTELDLENCIWRLSAEATKANRQTEVPLTPEAVKAISELPRGTGPYVISTELGKTALNSFSDVAEMLRDRMKDVPTFTLHDLRRTVASHLGELGVPRETIKKILNHSDGDVTAIYERSTQLDAKRRALELLAQKVSGELRSNVVRLSKSA